MNEFLNTIPPYIIYITLVLFGLIIGSFLNVCIFRMPREKSVAFPRSFCPKCRTQLKWYENIPVFSYIALGGKCRHCKRRISFRYPLIEILSAFFSWFVFFYFDSWTMYLFYYLLLIAPLIVITFIDLEFRLIPDLITIPGIFVGAIAHFFLMHGTWTEIAYDVVLGIVVGGGFLALVGYGYEFIKKQEGLGGGDVKLAAMLGAFFGWKGVVFILFMSSIVGSIVGLVLVVIFRKGMKYAIPYGPFLAIAALIYLFFGDQILNWYLGFL